MKSPSVESLVQAFPKELDRKKASLIKRIAKAANDRDALEKLINGWEMFVDFNDGTKFHSHYASINVFKIVMRRQRSLRGVKVTVHPSQGSNYEIAL